MPADPVLLGIAASAGVATFFSPCAVGLLPAYVGYYLGLDGGERPGWGPAARAGAGFGAAAGLGIIAVVLAAALAVGGLRSVLPFPQEAAGDAVRWAAVLVGLTLLVLGILLVADRGPRPRLPLDPPERRTPAAMAAFGAVFAVGSMGCTLPLFLGIVVQALTQGPLGAFLTVLAYGAGLAGTMLAASAALGAASDRTGSALRAAAPRVRPVGGLLLVAGGAYVLWYYLAVLPG